MSIPRTCFVGGLATIVGIAGGWWLLRPSARLQPDESAAVTAREDAASHGTVPSPGSQPTATAGSFRDRLGETETAPNGAQRRLARAAILMEWLNSDYAGAFAFLRAEKFTSLTLAGIAPFVAMRADVDQLVVVANESALTFDVLQSLGPSLSDAKLHAFIAAAERITPAKQSDVAAGIAATLTSRNLDAALGYAHDIKDPAVQASAFATIIDTLVTKRATTDALALADSLPAVLRNTDAVRFAHGNALSDAAPDQALNSLAGIADPTTRRVALIGFSRNLESRAPAIAIEAIFEAGLTPEGTLSHATRVLQTWSAHDPAAARAFLTSSSALTDEQRSALAARITTPSPP